MESCSLQSPAITTVPSSLSRSGFIEKPLGHGRILKLPTSKRYPLCRKFKTFDFRAQVSGTTKISSEVAGTISNKADSKDEDLAFVAGATGRVGSRTVRELLKLGFRVRAGVRSAQRAQSLVQSVKQMKLDTEGTTPVEKLELVECDLEKQDTIVPAIGNASVVICSIGASEKEVFDITGPYRIDYQATKNLIVAATVAKVNHFILVSSLGTNKVGFPAAILNLFWGVLVWKRKAEEALIASGLPYTIVRPGGMERPTDAFKETHNIRLSNEDTLFGGLVSNLQVAELMACMAKNRSLSYCKVVEVVAETTAPLRPMEELLAKIPSKRADISSTKEPDAPTSAPAKSIVTEKPATPTEEPAQEKAVETRPLSPYAAYDDLKPPSSPSPTPNGPKEVSSSASAPAENVSTSTEGNSATTAVAKSIIIEKPATPTEEPAQGKAVETRPLSPYAAYDDLKPPSSPSPTPNGPKEVSSSASAPAENVSTSTEGNSVTTAVAKSIVIEKPATPTEEPAQEKAVEKMPLSPYAAYDDLKPPSSPSPAPSGPKEVSSSSSAPAENVSTSTEGNTATTAVATGISEKDSSKQSVYHSPYYAYADLKPPSSPSPRAPATAQTDNESQGAALSGNRTPQPPLADKPSEEQHDTKPKPRPLSPFAMYEDLKPPTSPIPSSPKKS